MKTFKSLVGPLSILDDIYEVEGEEAQFPFSVLVYTKGKVDIYEYDITEQIYKYVAVKA